MSGAQLFLIDFATQGPIVHFFFLEIFLLSEFTRHSTVVSLNMLAMRAMVVCSD